jgi:hypothetical protein
MAVTDASGRAEVDMLVLGRPGDYKPRAIFVGTSDYLASMAAWEFTIEKAMTFLSLSPGAVQFGDATQVTAALTLANGRPLGERAVVFEFWSDAGADPVYQVAAVVDYAGQAVLSSLPLEPGVYEVRVSLNSPFFSDPSILIAIYDPTAGFVTGGGWIDSPAGAYAADAALTGKATFGFVAKYKKGAKVPTGQTQFRFKVADLSFSSSSYEWLVVAGPQAKYKGSGTINDAGDYGFMLTAIDADLTPSTDVDGFRIKIWDKATDGTVYDNKMGESDDSAATADIGGGNIVIHKK